MPIGNLIFSAGILYSGSSPAKVLQYFKLTGIQFISIRAYNYVQSVYLVPSVRNVWQRHQENICQLVRGSKLILEGDGRCDSPGYCQFKKFMRELRHSFDVWHVAKGEQNHRQFVVHNILYVTFLFLITSNLQSQFTKASYTQPSFPSQILFACVHNIN